MYFIFCVLFMYCIDSFWHLCLFAFTFTYLNIVTLFEFGVYPTLMTGNYFNSALDIRAENYHDALFRLSLIGSCTLLGTALDCYIVTKLQSRHHAFAVIMVLLVISVVVTDLASDTTESKYCLCILCVTAGAMVHWSQKLGYTCSAMTGNMFKLSEFFFKWFNGYDLGGPKMHGEILIIMGIMVFSVMGAMGAVSVTKYHEVVTLYPLMGTIPFHLYLSGCLEVWGLLGSGEKGEVEGGGEGGKSDSPPNPSVEMTSPAHSLDLLHSSNSVESPLQMQGGPRGEASVDEEGRRSSIVTDEDHHHSRGSVFERVSITLEELQEVEDLEKSFGYRVEKSMNLAE